MDSLQIYIKNWQDQCKRANDVMDAVGKPELKRPVPSGRDILQSMGYDKANAMGFVEPHRDAWGVNMRRDPSAWDNNWSATYD